MRVVPPCVGPVVELRRSHTNTLWRGPLLDCRGRVRSEALAALSVLASPRPHPAGALAPELIVPVRAAIVRAAPVASWAPLATEPEARRVRQERNTAAATRTCPRGQEPETPSPSSSENTAQRAAPSRGARRARGQVAERLRCRAIVLDRDVHTRDVRVESADGVRVVHPRLVSLVAEVSQRFAGHPIEIVSGFRPSRDVHAGSRHAHARALDFRVVSVPRERLRDVLRTLPLVGVGYYPHSVFVHLDVRDAREGSARWTDYAEPGERARYGQWPPRAQDVQREIVHITERVDALLERVAQSERARGSQDSHEDNVETHEAPSLAEPAEAP